jgi:hypothetical protein
MTNEALDFQFPTLRGVQKNAVYTTGQIKQYDNNMLIEALPKIWTLEEFQELVTYKVDHDPDTERQLSIEERLHVVSNAGKFYEPLGRDVTLEHTVSRMIRQGLVARGPFTKYWHQINQKVEQLVNELPDRTGEISLEKLQTEMSALRSSSRVTTLLGVGGIGKTTALNQIISLYPQVIIHSEYKGMRVAYRHLVWLKIDCPHDGSLRQFCQSFLLIVDQILQTDYYTIYGKKGRASLTQVALGMAIVASRYSVGLLIVDEIQNLLEARGGGEKLMINFFVNLINILNIPILLIGTPKVAYILGCDFRITRRTGGDGEINWTRFQADDPDWEVFLTAMWDYQYVKNYVERTPEIKNALYHVSQGVPDIAIKYFVMAQIRGIENNTETFNEVTIKSVCDQMPRLDAIMEYVRAGNEAALENIGDIDLNSTDSLIKTAQMKLLQNRMEANRKQRHGRAKNESDVQKPSRRRKDSDYLPNTLMNIVIYGEKSNLSAYDALKKAQYIKSPAEFSPDGVPWE